MKFLKLFLIFIISLSIKTNAQTYNYFHKYITSPYPELNSITIYNIIANDSSFIATGGYFSYLGAITASYIYNYNGDTIYSKKIQKDSVNFYAGRFGSLKKNSNYGYSLGGSRSSLFNKYKSGLLVRFNDVMDTLWTKRYLIDTLFVAFYDCVETYDGGFAMIGTKSISNTNDQIVLLKTDSLGNMLWYKYYGGLSDEAGMHLIQTPDSGLVLGGFSRSFNSQVAPYYAGDWYIIKTDSIGNTKWSKHIGNPSWDDGYVGSITLTNDTCLVLSGKYGIGEDSHGYELGKAWIVKMNMNGNIIWEKKYDNAGERTAFHNAIELEDGSLAAVGMVDSMYYNDFRGIFYKLDNNGNKLWRREYNGYNNIFTKSYLFTLSSTPDNGYLLGGYCINYDTVPPQRAWLIKTNCIGFDGPPKAEFSFSGNYNTINFTNLSQKVDSVIWNFGDGTALQYSHVNDIVQHTYSDTGAYTVSLIAYNGCNDFENDTITQILNITQPCGFSDYPQAFFTDTVILNNIAISNQSLNADSCIFNFGDGNYFVSCSDSIFHTYQDTGIYVINLTIFNSCTGDSSFFSDTVNIIQSSVYDIASNKEYFVIYPNPTKELLNISSNFNFEEISIYDIYGNRLYYKQNPKNQETINIKHLKSGIYTIKAGHIYKQFVVFE